MTTPQFIRRAHEMQIMGMPQASLGDISQPYDLNQPGAVAEIKRTLVALAVKGSDPLTSKDPIIEDIWQNINIDPDYIDAWDGPTSDEFVLALSRYRNGSEYNWGGDEQSPPFTQLYVSPYGFIIGGPQPAAHGLEILAGAAYHILGDVSTMATYMAWRDGHLPPPSNISGPDANTPVKMSERRGPNWNPLGYTQLWDGAAANLKAEVEKWDKALVECWGGVINAKSEQERSAYSSCFKTARMMRHDAVKEANKGAPVPECTPGWVWDNQSSTCEPVKVVTLPPVVIDFPNEAKKQDALAGSSAHWWILGGLSATVFWAFRKKL